MTKVVHLITRYLNGGAETTTRNTLEALSAAEEDYDLELATGIEYNPEQLRDLAADGIETTVFRTIRHYNPFTAVLAVIAVAWHLRRVDAEVLHTHSTEAGIIGRWAGRLAGTQVIIHEIHGDPITSDRNPVLNAILLALERASAPLADQLVVKAKRIKEMYLKRGIGQQSQYKIIYHGVDIERFQGLTKNSEKSETAPVKLLFVGRLTDGKGLYDLLDGIDRLDNIQLDIAGDGPLADSLVADIEDRDLDARVLGYRDDVPELMAQADIFVLPSYREGTPRVITEAMAAGLPVIGTNIAGIPEQVINGETGYLIEPGDVDALVSHIHDLVINPNKRYQFGKRAMDRVDRFAVDTAKQEYQQLYKTLVNDQR